MTSSLVRRRTRERGVAERTPLLREQGVAGSNPVIPTSIYKERPSRGRSFFLSSGPYLVRIASLIGSLGPHIMSSLVFRGGVLAPGQIRYGASSGTCLEQIERYYCNSWSKEMSTLWHIAKNYPYAA